VNGGTRERGENRKRKEKRETKKEIEHVWRMQQHQKKIRKERNNRHKDESKEIAVTEGYTCDTYK
jgi:hypothetical protein